MLLIGYGKNDLACAADDDDDDILDLLTSGLNGLVLLPIYSRYCFCDDY